MLQSGFPSSAPQAWGRCVCQGERVLTDRPFALAARDNCTQEGGASGGLWGSELRQAVASRVRRKRAGGACSAVGACRVGAASAIGSPARTGQG